MPRIEREQKECELHTLPNQASEPLTLFFLSLSQLKILFQGDIC